MAEPELILASKGQLALHGSLSLSLVSHTRSFVESWEILRVCLLGPYGRKKSFQLVQNTCENVGVTNSHVLL
jgi:hypothetical protein